MPVANAFLKKEDLEKEEFFYSLEVGFCEKCKMVQLIEFVPYDKYIVPDENKKTHYLFFASTSKYMERHFAEFAKEIEERFLSKNSKVLEIGSNDGIMLKAFKKNKVLGVEPSSNVAEVARKLGVETIIEFFTKDLANKIITEKGKFKAILSANVTLNIHDLHEVLEASKILLEEDGVFVTEDPYIIDILSKNAYDQIYDEHVYYFSLTSLQNLFEMHGMEIFDAKRQPTHGGSMRVYACKKGRYEKTYAVKELFDLEKEKRLDKIATYEKFAREVEESKIKLIKLLKKLKEENKKIVGYAAASKGTIVLNYCNIGKGILDYISDSTPEKQGLFNPGKHIPIVSPEKFKDDNADYALLGAWNHAEEIMNKETEFLKRGGKFIVHLPTPKILENGRDLI